MDSDGQSYPGPVTTTVAASHSVQQPVNYSVKKPHKVYLGRYYVLIVTALLAMQQNIAWLTFGPIPRQAYEKYGLTDAELTLLPEYSPIAFIFLTVPFTWFLYRYGLRVVVIGGAWILAIGCGIRVFIPYEPHSHNWIWVMHIGHILIGLVGLPIMIVPSQVSSVWFPINQRSFATAVAANAQAFGVGIGFVMIAYLTEQYGIRTMLYVQAEIALFVALLATIYFPPHPPTPPSYSANEQRTDFIAALKKLIKNPNFILLIFSGGISTGAIFAFSSVLGIILNPSFGFNNNVIVYSVDEFFYSVAWLGSVSPLAGTAVGQITGFLADRFQKKFKFILLLLMTLCTIFSLWFSLSIYGWGSQNPINYFVSFTLINVFSLATIPIFFEAIVECTYPVSEGTSVAGLALTTNAATLFFGIIGLCNIFSNSHPERAKAMAWVLTGLSAIATLLIVIYREDYQRLTVDKQGIQTTINGAYAATRDESGIQSISEHKHHSETSPLIYTD